MSRDPQNENENELSSEEESFFDAACDQDDPMGISELELRKIKNRHTRAWLFLGIVLVLGLALVYFIRQDLAYFFKSTEPIDLGVAEDMQPISLEHNEFVRVQGIARDMCIRADVFTRTVRFMYLLGSEMGSRIIVESEADQDQACAGAVDSVFSGRILNLSRVGRYERVIAYYREHFPGAPEQGPIYVLQDGHAPRSSWWYPLAIVVVLVLWGFNAWMLWRTRGLRARLGGQGGTS